MDLEPVPDLAELGLEVGELSGLLLPLFVVLGEGGGEVASAGSGPSRRFLQLRAHPLGSAGRVLVLAGELLTLLLESPEALQVRGVRCGRGPGCLGLPGPGHSVLGGLDGCGLPGRGDGRRAGGGQGGVGGVLRPSRRQRGLQNPQGRLVGRGLLPSGGGVRTVPLGGTRYDR